MEHKEAIEIVKKNYPHVGFSGSQFETALRVLVPELAESEDERIRKELISFVNKYYGEETKKEVLAYLEKQKEQPSTADDIAAAYQMGLAEGRKEQQPAEQSEDERIMKELIDFFRDPSETKVTHANKFKEWYAWLVRQKEYIEDIRQYAYNKGLVDAEEKQKPVAWSEEDKKMLDNTLDSLRRYQLSMPNFQVELQMRWLKSLRPQPKQDVSPSLREKEIICLKRALDYLRKEHNRYGGEDFTNEIAVLEWLITRPISVSDTHWKPSEEQMEALRVAAYEPYKNWDKLLQGLYADLQKLM